MDSHYVLRSFNLNTPLYGDQARAATADLLDLIGEPAHALMHYDEGGRNLPGFSPVKFLGRRNGFALLGLGNEGQEMVDAIAGPLARAWSAKLGRHVLQERSHGSCLLIPRPFQLQYTVPRTVVQHKPKHLQSMRNDPAKHLAALVDRNIKAQAEYLHIAVPEHLNIVVQDFRERKPEALKHGGAYLMRGDITFSANVQLGGWWSFGYLTARGFGQLNSDLAQAQSLTRRFEKAANA